MTPKQAAYKLLRHYKLASPTLDNLNFIVDEAGYDIVDYDPKNQSESFRILAEELELTPQILDQNAFVFSTGITHILFVRDNLTPEDKRLAIAHELGHIILGHLQNPQHIKLQNIITHGKSKSN